MGAHWCLLWQIGQSEGRIGARVLTRVIKEPLFPSLETFALDGAIEVKPDEVKILETFCRSRGRSGSVLIRETGGQPLTREAIEFEQALSFVGMRLFGTTFTKDGRMSSLLHLERGATKTTRALGDGLTR
jgi:hypothetical protein